MLAARMRIAAAASGGNWWEAGGASGAVRVYQPKGAASLAASYTDLTGNQDAAPGTAPTWDAANGWIFVNTSSQYLTTGWAPDNDQSQSVLIQFSDVGAGNNYMLGSSNGAGNNFLLTPQHSGNVRYFNGGSVFVSPNLTAGNIGLAGNRGYRNGTAEGAGMSAWSGSGIAIYIGARNNAGSPADYVNAYVQAVAIYDNDIGASAMLAVATEMAAL